MVLKQLCLFIFGCAGPLLPHRLFSSCGTQASLCGGFSCCGALTLHQLRAVAHGLHCLHGLWDLPRPGIKLRSPALAGGFFSTEPSGKLVLFSCQRSDTSQVITRCLAIHLKVLDTIGGLVPATSAVQAWSHKHLPTHLRQTVLRKPCR